MEQRTESGWNGTNDYLPYLSVIWNKNLTYSEKINESRDIGLVLKSLSDYYYGLLSLKKSIIFFIEANEDDTATINKHIADIKELTEDKEILQCKFDWAQIYKIRNILIAFDEDLFRVQGKCKLLAPLVIKRTYESLTEQLDEENV
jgi:hypothetical protein